MKDIKVWMLTGDKLETAENIAKSCNLILPNMNILYIREETANELENNLVSISTVINKDAKDKKSLVPLIKPDYRRTFAKNHSIRY